MVCRLLEAFKQHSDPPLKQIMSPTILPAEINEKNILKDKKVTNENTCRVNFSYFFSIFFRFTSMNLYQLITLSIYLEFYRHFKS